MEQKRFIKTMAEEVGEEPDIAGVSETEWWLDTKRPIKDKPGYIAVQTYKGKDPNDFVQCENMQTLFNDQAEYYFVCRDCYAIYRHMQWAGSTRGSAGWRERANERLQKHEQQKGWCQFCDPIFGNGGWSI